jgi:hypothetical protein
MRYCWFLLLVINCSYLPAQEPSDSQVNDSIKKAAFLRHLGNGYLPTKYFNFDLRYLIKYNQYEGFRTGLGGITNNNFSNSFRIEGYTVYGFLDEQFKLSVGAGYLLASKTNSWFNIKFTKDLEETGSSNFLTDKRFFQFFEPRLINIERFHKFVSRSFSLEHQLTPKILTESKFALNKIEPAYYYIFNHESLGVFEDYDLTIGTFSVQWSPFSKFERKPTGLVETNKGYPKFTAQYSKSFDNLFSGEFSFSKFDFRIIQQFRHKDESTTEMLLTAGLADGDIPLSHLYHSFPNNVTKETILQRFSVAGNNSFETMYFNEFYSDTFLNFQLKHKFCYLEISPWFKPQITLISRHAIGDMKHQERHQGVSFQTLEKGYNEVGLEINRLLFGFGLSFAYRYGSYHLSQFEDNFAFKFTFNIQL